MSEEEVKMTEAEFTEKYNEGAWINTLEEPLLKDPSMAKFAKGSPSQLAQSYVELQKMMGGDKAPAPKQSFSKKEWDTWNKDYNEGYPSESTEYDLTIENMPEDMPIVGGKEESEKMFQEMSHKYGLTRAQAEGLWKESKGQQIDHYNEVVGNIQSQKDEGISDLKKEWGSKYDDNMKVVRGVLNKFGDEEVLEEIKQSTKQGKIFKMLATIGDNFKEETLELDSRSGSANTPAEIKLKIATEMAKPAYSNRKDPAHKLVFQEVMRLNKELVGE